MTSLRAVYGPCVNTWGRELGKREDRGVGGYHHGPGQSEEETPSLYHSLPQWTTSHRRVVQTPRQMPMVAHWTAILSI